MKRGARRIAIVAAIALALPCVASVASAHTRSVSYSRWRLGEAGARVELRIAALELTRFAAGEPRPEYFSAHLRLIAGESPCTAGTVERIADAPSGWAVFRWDVACERSSRRAVESSLLADVVTSHVHFARLTDERGELHERFLSDEERLWVFDDGPRDVGAAGAGTTIARYAGLGIGHIALGWDHLAFLAALLLLAGSLAEVTLLVTGFTVAHSFTLAMAVTGLIRPQPAAVETVIGFSIALVAAENAWLLAGRDRAVAVAWVAVPLVAAVLAAGGVGNLPWLAWAGLALFTACHFRLLADAHRRAQLRAVVAFAFGLVHGLGFAGVLLEMDLPAARLAPALFGFNIGVELGQLAVIAIAWPLLRALARYRSRWHRLTVEIGSAAIFCVGVFWLVVRGWG